MWALEWLECTYRKCGSFINGAGGEAKWERDKLGTCVSLKSFLTTGWDPPPPSKRKGSSFVKLIFEAPPDSRWHRVCVEIYVEIKLSLAYIILSQRNCVIVISGASGTRLAVYLFLPCISSKLWWQQERKWSSFSPTQRKRVFLFFSTAVVSIGSEEESWRKERKQVLVSFAVWLSSVVIDDVSGVGKSQLFFPLHPYV